MSLAFPRPRFLAVLALSTALAGPAAWAQTSSYDTGSDPVSVDLSVIDNAGQSSGLPPAAAPSYGYDLGSGENLRVPGPRSPVSQLHVQVPGGRSSQPAARAARSTPAPAPAPAAVPRKEVATAPAEPKAEATPAAPTMPETAPKKPDSAPARLEPEAKTPPAPEQPSAPEKEPAETAAKETAPAPPPEPAPAPSAPPPSAPEASAPPPAPEAAPAPEPAAKPDAPETQTAATDATGGNGQGSLRLDFAADETKLPGDATADLGKLAEQLAAKEGLRVQLLAYAGGDDLSASKARRISLSRALSVRSFLIDKGVRSTRIDVRALGDKTDEEPKNRVDVEVVER